MLQTPPGLRSLLLLILLGASGCEGVLREKPGESSGDAPVVNTIPPPACAELAVPTGAADCTGGGAPGDDCLMCHSQAGPGAPFAFAGTLYDAAGTAPVGGATVLLQDAVGNVATAVSHPNGNFYVFDGFVMYPAKAFATLCPDILEMVNPVDQATGPNCNTSGCHTAGFRVHL